MPGIATRRIPTCDQMCAFGLCHDSPLRYSSAQIAILNNLFSFQRRTAAELARPIRLPIHGRTDRVPAMIVPTPHAQFRQNVRRALCSMPGYFDHAGDEWNGKVTDSGSSGCHGRLGALRPSRCDDTRLLAQSRVAPLQDRVRLCSWPGPPSCSLERMLYRRAIRRRAATASAIMFTAP